MSYLAILALIASLQQKVTLLERELAAEQNVAVQVQSVSNPFPVIPSSTALSPVLSTSSRIVNPTLGTMYIPIPVITLASVYFSGNDGNTLSDGTEVYQTGEPVRMCVVLLDQNNNPITDASATISTDAQPTPFIQGWGTVEGTYSFPAPTTSNCDDGIIQWNDSHTENDGYGSAMGYSFNYIPPEDGLHTIEVSALGSTVGFTVYSETTNQ